MSKQAGIQTLLSLDSELREKVSALRKKYEDNTNKKIAELKKQIEEAKKAGIDSMKKVEKDVMTQKSTIIEGLEAKKDQGAESFSKNTGAAEKFIIDYLGTTLS